jgi:CheY-like chemotaxis protein
VAVSDSGIGIDAEHQQRIFERFEQSDASTTRRFGGTGLGLTISRSLVQMMGGTLGVESRLGSGSTFWFEIPVQPADSPDAASPGPAVEPLRPGTVLVVEDNAVNQLVARRILERMGYSTELATDGEAAIRAAEVRTFDAILMDCQMPVMDGFEATRAIRRLETCRTIPIIAVTANALETTRQQCLDAGMNDLLTKPYSVDELNAKLRHWLPRNQVPEPLTQRS